jgi:hypothetical protein
VIDYRRHLTENGITSDMAFLVFHTTLLFSQDQSISVLYAVFLSCPCHANSIPVVDIIRIKNLKFNLTGATTDKA